MGPMSMNGERPFADQKLRSVGRPQLCLAPLGRLAARWDGGRERSGALPWRRPARSDHLK